MEREDGKEKDNLGFIPKSPGGAVNMLGEDGGVNYICALPERHTHHYHFLSPVSEFHVHVSCALHTGSIYLHHLVHINTSFAQQMFTAQYHSDHLGCISNPKNKCPAEL